MEKMRIRTEDTWIILKNKNTLGKGFSPVFTGKKPLSPAVTYFYERYIFVFSVLWKVAKI